MIQSMSANDVCYDERPCSLFYRRFKIASERGKSPTPEAEPDRLSKRSSCSISKRSSLG